MPGEANTLTREQAKAFYDRFGARQDLQAFYEVPATNDLTAHATFGTAQSVFEFGCGTGAFAEQVLSQYLPQSASYLAVDISETMVKLAQARLGRFGPRVVVQLTDGSPEFDASDGAFDRFVSNYVVDLLPASDITGLFAQAHRVLRPDGRLCLVSLTKGSTPLARFVTWGWTRIHAIRPSLVGGCRPLEVLDFLPKTQWRSDYMEVITSFGIASEVIVTSRIG